jgi:3-oxoacyl-[acyl-carrier protein] reductase
VHRPRLTEFVLPVDTYIRSSFIIAKAVAPHRVEAFSRHLAGELGGSGVRSVCVRSHAIPQTLLRGSHAAGVFATEARRQGLTEQMLEGAATGTVLKRLPTLDDLAATLLFLASDGAAAISGVVVNMSRLVLD